MAEWQTQKFADRLGELDGRVTLAISCFTPLPKLFRISDFTAERDQATHAFMATGTYVETYEGKLCTDGGLTTGSKMTPLFQDGLRPQLIVDLMKTGLPGKSAFTVRLDDYVRLIKVGMDEMRLFLTTGRASDGRRGILQMCPLGSDVGSNECKQAAESPIFLQ